MLNRMGLFHLEYRMSTNDVTGDRIVTKPSKKYEDNYDAIFRKDKAMFGKKPKGTGKKPMPGKKGKAGC
jgi:hypothetical protein